MICHVWKFCKDSTFAHACLNTAPPMKAKRERRSPRSAYASPPVQTLRERFSKGGAGKGNH